MVRKTLQEFGSENAPILEGRKPIIVFLVFEPYFIKSFSWREFPIIWKQNQTIREVRG